VKAQTFTGAKSPWKELGKAKNIFAAKHTYQALQILLMLKVIGHLPL
jgi:hypothetical protein